MVLRAHSHSNVQSGVVKKRHPSKVASIGDTLILRPEVRCVIEQKTRYSAVTPFVTEHLTRKLIHPPSIPHEELWCSSRGESHP